MAAPRGKNGRPERRQQQNPLFKRKRVCRFPVAILRQPQVMLAYWITKG